MSTNNIDNNAGQCPIGGILSYNSLYSPSLPDNFLNCDGSYYAYTVYPDLFSVIGYNYGASGTTSGFRNVVSSGFSSFETVNSIFFDGTYWVAGGGISNTSSKLSVTKNPFGVWTPVTLPSQFNTSAVLAVHGSAIYGSSGVWVAAGENGALATATNPMGTWTNQTSGFGTNNINTIASDGTNWCIGGNAHNYSYSTSPTTSWTNNNTLTGLSTQINSIWFIDNAGVLYFAVGNDNNGVVKNTVAPLSNSWTTKYNLNSLSSGSKINNVRAFYLSPWTVFYSGSVSAGCYITNDTGTKPKLSGTFSFDVNASSGVNGNGTGTCDLFIVGNGGNIKKTTITGGYPVSWPTFSTISNGFGTNNVKTICGNKPRYNYDSTFIVVGGEAGIIQYGLAAQYQVPNIANSIIRYQ